MDIDPLEAEIVKAQPRASKLGFDNLLEDVFGLNIRSLKTIWMLFKAPARYFDAARDSDWLGRYTPSFRIWFGLIAIMAASRFLYTGADDGMTQMNVQQFMTLKEQNPEAFGNLDVQSAAVDLVKWLFVFMPIAFIPLYAGLAFIFRAFTTPTSFVLRLRYVFGTVLPSTTIILLVSLAFAVPAARDYLMWISILSYPMMFIVDITTAYRGRLFATEDNKGLGLAVVFGTLLQVTYFIALILAYIPATAVTVVQNTSS